jgi:hypothetical protein
MLSRPPPRPAPVGGSARPTTAGRSSTASARCWRRARPTWPTPSWWAAQQSPPRAEGDRRDDRSPDLLRRLGRQVRAAPRQREPGRRAVLQLHRGRADGHRGGASPPTRRRSWRSSRSSPRSSPAATASSPWRRRRSRTPPSSSARCSPRATCRAAWSICSPASALSWSRPSPPTRTCAPSRGSRRAEERKDARARRGRERQARETRTSAEAPTDWYAEAGPGPLRDSATSSSSRPPGTRSGHDAAGWSGRGLIPNAASFSAIVIARRAQRAVAIQVDCFVARLLAMTVQAQRAVGLRGNDAVGKCGSELARDFVGRGREQARSRSQALKGERNLDCNAGRLLFSDSRLSVAEGVLLHRSG